MPAPKIVDEIMTRNPKTLPAEASVRAAAEEMKHQSVGAVVVEKNGELCGIVTDRDIVMRCLAEGGDCDEMSLSEICSSQITTLSPRDSIDRAVSLMRDKAIRRIPVQDNGKVVGIVSLGDLALVRDPESALGGISAAAPNA